jgi:Tfp pilus assembly protein PilV
MKRRKKHQNGLSLLEILVTMFLVMMGLLVVMSSFVAIAKSGRYSERMDIAATLAQREMERMRNTAWATMQPEIGIYNEYPDQPLYRHEIVINNVGSVREIIVRIYFDNDRRRAEIRTFVSNL